MNGIIMINRCLRYLPLFLLSFLSFGVLGAMFQTSAFMSNGLTTVQSEWAWWAMLILGIAVGALLLKTPSARFCPTMIDAAAFLFAAGTVASYDFNINPAPARLIFLGLLSVWWFFLRVMLSGFPRMCQIFPILLVLTAAVEAIWGIKQLYGQSHSFHSLYNLTGSFYNPGPYSCYVALLLPLALHETLKRRDDTSITGRLLFYLYAAVVALSIVVLPAGDSRTAWAAAIVGSAYIFNIHFRLTQQLVSFIRRSPLVGMGSMVMALLIGIGTLYGLYQYKEGSANGRLLMWKLTVAAAVDHLPMGTGIGGFPAAYAERQALYFSNNNHEAEQRVAGSPEYAFNEYAQILLERGVVGFLSLILLIGLCIRSAHRNRNHGVAAAWLSFAMVMFASYPLELIPFRLLFVALAVLSIKEIPLNEEYSKRRIGQTPILIIVGGLCLGLLTGGLYQAKQTKAYQQWSTAKITQQPESYNELYPRLHYNHRFLFDYAKCLMDDNRPQEALPVLQRAALVSSDPMVHNVMGRCHEQSGQYNEAEARYQYAARMVPTLLYPHFLLMKLYLNNNFLSPNKAKAQAQLVLHFEPKVSSRATNEMKAEAKKALETLNDRAEK